METAGVILCGGRSARMGRPKAGLPFGAELLLPRVVRLVREAVGPVVVVAAPDQDVPPLPAGVRVVRDAVPGRGPLGGLAAGLAALDGRADGAYASGCDAPLLRAEFVRRMVELLWASRAPGTPGTGSSVPLIAVPRVGGRLHPLAAVYSVAVRPVVDELLGADRLRMTDLFGLVPTRFVGPDELAAVDPEFRSLRNVNTPDEYEAALRELDSPATGEAGRP
jgi:molybdopterin-guanine dinucleotide biosynthesis protein A